MVFERDDRIVAGFQLLAKRWKGPLRIGYVSKGPVLTDPSLADTAIGKLKSLARDHRLTAIVVQAPDRGFLAGRHFGEDGFLRAPDFLGVIRYTLINELSTDPDGFKASLRKSTRYGVNRAGREGVSIEFGRREDLPEFFRLMRQTCRRQGTQPNPASVDALYAMWDGFAPRGQLELTFAVWQGRKLAGQVTFSFGDTVTVWKVGWSEEAPETCPNHLLRWEVLTRSAREGFRFCDFAAMTPHIAEGLLRGERPSGLEQSRDFFHLGFGGHPMVLACPYLYFPNPVIGSVFSRTSRN